MKKVNKASKISLNKNKRVIFNSGLLKNSKIKSNVEVKSSLKSKIEGEFVLDLMKLS